MRSILTAITVFAFGLCASGASSAQELLGVNISGAEFGSIRNTITSQYPYGRKGYDYSWPNDESIRAWVQDAGAKVLRIPFRWERIQPEPNGSVDLADLIRIARMAGSAGATVIFDMHNYGRRWLREHPDKEIEIGEAGGRITPAMYADVWAKIAKEFADDPYVEFDLMNEPHDMTVAGTGAATEADMVAAFYQAAIEAIRGAGASNRIHVEPTNWAKPATLAGAFSNAALRLKDPANNLVFHIHQYIDNGEQGDDISVLNNDPQAGVKKLERATAWAKQNGKKLFLGEFGVARTDETQRQAAGNMLDHIRANADVWTGWTAWAGGAKWKDSYHFLLEIKPPGSENPARDFVMARFAENGGAQR